jgi:hypothetical protein
MKDFSGGWKNCSPHQRSFIFSKEELKAASNIQSSKEFFASLNLSLAIVFP